MQELNENDIKLVSGSGFWHGNVYVAFYPGGKFQYFYPDGNVVMHSS